MKVLNVNPASEKVADSHELNAVQTLQTMQADEQTGDIIKDLLPGIEYVGCGYDVLGGYANARFLKSALFDIQSVDFKDIEYNKYQYKIYKFIEVVRTPQTSFTQTTAVSSQEFSKKISEKFEIGGAYEGFSASATTGFEKSITESTTNSFTNIDNYAHYYYTIFDVDLFVKYLKDDVRKLINSGDPAKLFDKYGTHFLAGMVYGAKASISLTFDKYNNNINTSTTVDAKASFLGLINGESSVNTSSGTKISLSSGQIKVKTFGGDITINPESLLKDGGFDKWCDSITLDNSSMVDFATNGSKPLIGIWELAETAERKEFIEKEANRYITDRQVNNMNRGLVNYLISVKTGKKDYAGTGKYVAIQIFGKLGTSAIIELSDSGNFEKNTVKEFELKLEDLGTLEKIIIFNNNYDHKVKNPGWFLDKIDITAGATKITKNNPHYYSNKFVLDNWLKNDKGFDTKAEIQA
jgi:hypothetical protein